MKPGERFKQMVVEFVDRPDGDEERPTWDEVEAAQKAYLASIKKSFDVSAPRPAMKAR